MTTPNSNLEKSIVPEFSELLDRFNNELAKMDENAGIIYEKLNVIKNIKVPIQTNESLNKPEKEPNGILEELFRCLNRMNRLNSLLNESKEGLLGLVG